MTTPQESSEEGIACSILERHHSSLSQSMTSPYTVVRICQILYSKRCVDESALGEVESANTSLEDKIAVLLAAVKTKVFIDHRKLHELATLLDQFKETKSVANNIISDYNDECTELHKTAAREAVRKNITDLNEAVSQPFENIILACQEKDLITSGFRQQLLHTPHKTRCIEFIDCIYNTVGLNPAYLDTFLSILHDEGPATSEVAKSVAKHYGYALPKYEEATNASLTATGTVRGATSVVSSDDNVEEMVPQYDQMSNEDRASDILRTHYSTLSQSLKDPVNIARLLHGENVISEDAITQVDSASIKDRTTVLLGSVRRAVHDSHQHLNIFGRVLQQLTAGNERVGQDISKDYDRAFSVKNEISHEMEEEFTGIKIKFGIMCTKINRALETNNVSLEEMKRCCKFTYTKLSHQVESCQTMEDVLMFVAKKCTLIKIRLLKELIEFCNVAEAKQHIQDYQQAIDDFSQNMRARFPLNQSLLPDGTPHPLRGETITFVMKWVSESVSLDDINDLQTYAFGSLFDNVNVIQIVPGNSVIITCSFPFELTGFLMAEAMKNLKLLKKNGLLKLTIGYCTIWNIRDKEEKEETTDVQSTNEKVNSERERELEQPLQGTDKLNEIISHKDKEVKELQEKVDLLIMTEQLNLEKRGNDAKEEMNEETVGDASDITDQQRDQTFPSQTTTPPSLSDTPSDKQLMLKQQIKAMIMENETLKSQLMKSKEEREIEATSEIEMLQDKLSEKQNLLLKKPIKAMKMENETLKLNFLMKSKEVREIEAAREIEMLQNQLLVKDSFFLKRGLENGYIELLNINIKIMGPPCVGKTAFLNLLLNWTRPRQHNSTPIASRPVRAIERVANVDGEKIWQVISVDETLATLTDAIKDTNLQTIPPDTTPSINIGESLDDVHQQDTATQLPFSTDRIPDEDDEIPRSKPKQHKYSSQMLDHLKKRKQSAELHKATWINLLDSGGLPQFADISRAFFRGNSINIIVIKLTEKLSDKPEFVYSINGKVVNAPSELKMTNLQLIQHFVRSIGCSRNTVATIGGRKIVSKPYFVIVGTCLDLTTEGFIRKRDVISESIAEKNEQILSSLSEFRDQFIFHDDPSQNDLIFPVDNLCRWKRSKTSALIRERIISQKDVGFKVPIPVKWYMFDLYLKDEVEESEHGVVSMERCRQIGESLSMSHDETKACVMYLDSVTSCLHYKDILPDVVFTNPQYLLEMVTDLVRTSFMELEDLQACSSLSLESQKSLKEDGVFEESILDQLNLSFVPGIFTQRNFLELLKYLRVAASIDSTDSIKRYFFPIVLPPDELKREDKEKLSKSCDPLIITFDNKLIPQGIFSCLIASLMSLKEKPQFYIDSHSQAFPRQLRYAVRLYSQDILGAVILVDRFYFIEIYFSGHQKYCYLLREVIGKCLESSCKELSYDVKFNMTVPCKIQDHFISHHNTQIHPVNISWTDSPPLMLCSIETEQPVCELTDDRRRCWFIESASIINDPISKCLPHHGPLDERHAMVLIEALNEVVEWKILGIYLGISYAHLTTIEHNSHFQINTSRKDLIIEWLKSGTATRKDLITALKKMDNIRIVEEIERLPTE